MERAGTEATISLDRGQWTVRALPDRLAVRVETAEEEDLRRIQDLLTTRLERFRRREHLTVTWQAATAEARTTDGPEDHQAERARLPAQLPADRIDADRRDEGSGG
ncbi:MAG TPA: DUF2218 domain-containing protein [Streptosporangiaceae bacterium]|nr:DUF2218 domain-containing protein [Streptosporangiaceae bacterium]